jgi:hypothetical protein
MESYLKRSRLYGLPEPSNSLLLTLGFLNDDSFIDEEFEKEARKRISGRMKQIYDHVQNELKSTLDILAPRKKTQKLVQILNAGVMYIKHLNELEEIKGIEDSIVQDSRAIRHAMRACRCFIENPETSLLLQSINMNEGYVEKKKFYKQRKKVIESSPEYSLLRENRDLKRIIRTGFIGVPLEYT